MVNRIRTIRPVFKIEGLIRGSVQALEFNMKQAEVASAEIL